MNQRLVDYKHKCTVIKQIQSKKALRYKKINTVQNVITISISAFITFLGFSGKDMFFGFFFKLFNVDNSSSMSETYIEFIYNTLVFILFFETILHLIFQFGNKQYESEKAIQLLSSLINEIDDLLLGLSKPIDGKTLELINYKYNSIMQIVPSNTDKEYKRAKKSISQKKTKSENINSNNFLLLSKDEQEKFIVGLIENNHAIHNILTILRDENQNLYLGGGLIRNMIWDFLHNYNDPTPIDDVDIIYYDSKNIDKAFDKKIEENLSSKKPNALWSVKNQCRMHTINDDAPYSSLQDAVSKFPETSSAIIVRYKNDNTYEFVAPFGYDDLFRLIVKPTPHFMGKLDKYKERMDKKNWNQTWEKVDVLYMDS